MEAAKSLVTGVRGIVISGDPSPQVYRLGTVSVDALWLTKPVLCELLLPRVHSLTASSCNPSHRTVN